VLSDHFSQPTLDPGTWVSRLPWGRESSPELQYYAKDAVEAIGGLLRMTADRRDAFGHAYTSGAISSLEHFALRYGYVQIRAKVPSGRGLWPAFWLLADGEGSPSEIDVFEILGDQPNTVYMTNHWQGPDGERLLHQGAFSGPDFSQAFHTFAADWEPAQIIWYVDGVERFRSDQGVPSEPMALIADLAVGGDWPGNPDASTIFPAYLDISYIEAYQRANR
jgi:beta-glucanase (GH16 family)